MRTLRITVALAIVGGLTFMAAKPALSSRGALARGFFSQPDNASASAEVDALERQPNIAIYPGQWVSVSNVSDVRTRHAIDFTSDGHFTSGYTVKRDDRVLVDENGAGTYAVHGRTVTFEMDSGGSHVTRRVRIKQVDGVHLVLLTPNDAPLSLTRIFDAQAANTYAP